MRKLIVSGLLLLGLQLLNAQDTSIEKTKHLLAISTNDTVKLDLLTNLYFYYIFSYPDSALEYARQEVSLAREMQSDDALAISYFQYSHFLSTIGNYPQALRYAFESAKLGEKTGDWLQNVRTYTHIASIYDDLGDFGNATLNVGKAKSLFQKNWPAFPKNMENPRGSDTLWFYLFAQNTQIEILLNTNQLDSALKYLQRNNTIMKKINGNIDDASVQEKFGNIYRKKGQYAKAIPYYHYGLSLFHSENGTLVDVMKNALGLANTYRDLHKNDSSIFYANKVLALSKATYNPLLKLDALNILASVYKSKQNSDSVAKYLDMIITTRDSLFSQKKSAEIQGMQFDEQLRQQELATRELEYRNKTRMYALLAALIVFFAVAFQLFRNNREKQKSNRLLAEEKTKVEAALKKSEELARDAQIEAALERVRAGAMAMQSYEEIGTIIESLYAEFTHLDLPLEKAIIIVFDPKANATTWYLSNRQTGVLQRGYFMPKNEQLLNPLLWKGWSERESKWQFILGGEEKKKWDSYVFYTSSLAELPDPVKNFMQELTRVYLNASFVNFGGILVASNDDFLDDKQFDILHRFTKVFDLAYTRFNDLKQAEAQAREARIEAALEKVRSRAMGMQKSDDILEVGNVLYQELGKLGIQSFTSGFVLVDEEKKFASHFVAEAASGEILPTPILAPIDQITQLPEQAISWKKQEPYLVIAMDHAETVEHCRQLVTRSLSFPHTVEEFLAFIPERMVLHSFNFKQGYLLIVDKDILQPEQLETAIRFARVFELSYTRYLDLKNAEAHAIQAEEDLIEIKTAKQRAEDALTELQATQKQLIQSEKMASLGELTAGIAHEIQNPLNFVNNFSEVNAELLSEMREAFQKGNFQEAGQLAQDLTSNMEKISEHGRRADSIVKGMLQHSRTSTGQKELTDINALCDEYLRLSYHGMRAKDKTFNAAIKLDLDKAIKPFPVIPQDIGRVLLNVYNNAFYATHQKAKLKADGYEPVVRVSTKSTRDSVTIKVEDNGNGIPEKIREKIFQPFFTTKPTGQGTGLGLSLSYDIIKAHGGEIGVSSDEGRGASFVLSLPIS